MSLDGLVGAIGSDLAKALKIDPALLEEYLSLWQHFQEDVRDKFMEGAIELATAKAQKRKAKIPIWRCGACGRADLPTIACYVAPYIVRTEYKYV